MQIRDGWGLGGLYMTRDAGALTAQRLVELNAKGNMQRVMSVGAIDVDKRTVELAFSSEAEIQRWFGIEVLDHNADSVRLDRLRDAGAVLVDHDWTDQVAVVETVEISADRKGRAVVRFGRSARAQEIFQDVVDGIRKHVSVGYRLLAAVLAEVRDGDVEVIRITDWEPYEISFVSVPADTSVGVGRNAEIPPEEKQRANLENSTNNLQTRSLSEVQPTMNEKTLRDPATGNLVRAQVDDAGNIVKVLETLERAGDEQKAAGTRAAAAERTRSATILEMGDKYPGCAELAREYVKDGKTVEQFTAAALEKVNSRAAAPLAEQNSNADIGMSDKEVRRYSMMRAIRALSNPNDATAQKEAAFEIECSQTAQRSYKKEAKGILIPADVLGRAFNAGGAPNTPTGAITGSDLVKTELLTGSFIEMLRNRTAIMRLSTIMGGLVGNVEIPKQTGGATAYWTGEGEDATEGTPVIGQLALSPKSLAAYTDITRRLSMQATPDAEGIVRRDLMNAMAQAIDYAGYYGAGSDSQPRGIKNYTGINAVDFASAQKPTFAELVQMETEVAADNADIGQMGYIGNTRFRGWAKTTVKFASAGSATIWEPGNTVNGYRTEITNQVAADDVFFGNFADFIIAMWGGLDLTVDPYSLSKSGGLRIVVFQDVDMALRRVESICWGSAAVTP